MKKAMFDPMPRWRDQPPGRGTPEHDAAALIRGTLEPREPNDAQWARLQCPASLRRWRVHRSRLFGLRLALVATVLLVGAATVKAYQAARMAGWFAKLSLPTPMPEPRQHFLGRPRASTASPTGAIETDASAAPAELALDASPALVEPAPTPPQPSLASHPSPPTQPSQALLESQHQQRPPRNLRREATSEPGRAATSDEILALDEAVGLLRRKHDPGAALLALDAYLRRYPMGILNREARFARVDALLSLARMDDALAALEALPLDQHLRSQELRVVRGELRARADCRSAEEDFSLVLARGGTSALMERALYDRATCRAKRGDRARATEDLRAYVERYPNGAHVAWARRWLTGTDGL